MWDGISQTTLIAWVVAAITVGSGLGFLRRSKIRTTLIAVWTAFPVILVWGAAAISSFDKGSIEFAMSLGFVAVFTLMLLPPWAVLTLLPYNLVRRLREPQDWKAS